MAFKPTSSTAHAPSWDAPPIDIQRALGQEVHLIMPTGTIGSTFKFVGPLPSAEGHFTRRRRWLEGTEDLRSFPGRSWIRTVAASPEAFVDDLELLRAALPFCTSLLRILKTANIFSNEKIQDVKKLENEDVCAAWAAACALTQADTALARKDLGDSAAKAIAAAVKINPTLHKLVLYSNQIGPSGIRAIAEAIAHNGTLRRLSLNGNRMGDTGAQALAKALEANGTLWELAVRNCSIGAIGVQAIAEAIAHNATLQILFLNGNPMGDTGAQALAKALEANGALLRLIVPGCGIGVNGVQALEAVMKKKKEACGELFDIWGLNIQRP